MIDTAQLNPRITLKSHSANITVERNGRLLTAIVVGICRDCRNLHLGSHHDCSYDRNFSGWKAS